MDQKFFFFPFGTSGDKTTVPDDLQPDGAVSFEEGYTSDYSLDEYDPDSRDVERMKMNYMLFVITEALKQYQVFGTPEWITSADNGGSPYSYSKGAHVRYTGDGGSTWEVYESLVDGNTATPGTDATKWQVSRFPIQIQGSGQNRAITFGAGSNPIFIIQVGFESAISATSNRTVNLTKHFPNNHLGGVACPRGTEINACTWSETSLSTGTIYNGNSGPTGASYICWGN